MEHSYIFFWGGWFWWPNLDFLFVFILLVVDLVVVCQKDGGM